MNKPTPNRSTHRPAPPARKPQPMPDAAAIYAKRREAIAAPFRPK